MPVGVQHFRQLDSDEVSPFGGVLAKSIAMRLAQANAEKAEKEMPYAGVSALSKALSQSAYANAVQPQYALKAAAHPQIWSNMTPEQQAATVALGASPAVGGGNLNNSIQKQLMEIYNKENAPKEPVIKSLMKQLGFGGEQQAEPDQQQQMGSPMNYGQPSQPSLPQVPEDIRNQPTAFQNEANYKAGQQQAASKGTQIGAGEGKQLEELLKTTQQQASSAQMLTNNLKDFHKLYEKSWAKGVLDNDLLRKLDPDAQRAKQLQEIMAVNVAGQLFPEGSTNFGKQQAAQQKLNMGMSPSAEKGAFGLVLSGAERMKEINSFTQAAKDAGITDPTKIQQMWFDYNESVPYYDHEKQKPLDKNLGIDKQRYARFIDKQMAPHMNESISRKEAVARANEDQRAVDTGDYQVRMKSPDGKVALMHPEDVQEALAQGWSNA